jgi:hypothetical protein
MLSYSTIYEPTSEQMCRKRFNVLLQRGLSIVPVRRQVSTKSVWIETLQKMSRFIWRFFPDQQGLSRRLPNGKARVRIPVRSAEICDGQSDKVTMGLVLF